MKSGIATAYDGGKSKMKLLLQSNFVTGTGVLLYDGRAALMAGRYGDLAEMAGGVAGGFIIGKVTQKFGGYGLAIEDIGGAKYGPARYQGGSIGLKLVRPDAEFPVGANSTSRAFKTGEDVIHFEKHGSEIAQTLGYENYSLTQYVRDANSVITNGAFAPELNAYISIPGGTGSAKGLMVGLDRATGKITTMHMKPVSWFETKAPSLGWEAQPKTVRTNTVGPNPQSGWKWPY